MTPNLAAWIFPLLAIAASGQPADPPAASEPPPAPAGKPAALSFEQERSAEALAKEFADRLRRGRYMESKTPKDAVVPGWEGFPTKRHTYSVKDQDGTVKTADVVLLNPTAERIARWIVSAVTEVKGTYDMEEGRRVFQHILGQSGGQFPVAGVVYEDIIPADGRNEVYCFRDGVTVEVEGVEHRTTRPLTPAEIEASMSGKIRRVFNYARIQGTAPKQFIAAGGPAEILKDGKPTQKWLDEVRAAYQEAWTSDRNRLLVAWLGN